MVKFRISLRCSAGLWTIALALGAPTDALANSVFRAETTDSMHARYYSLNLGRFVSVDPIGGSIGGSQSWNRCSYVLNNPIRLVDPTGEYARGDNWTDEQWEKFQETQKRAADKMEERARKLEEKADKREGKGKDGVDDLRTQAESLRAGSHFLRSDDPSEAIAHAYTQAEYAMLPNTTKDGAAAATIGGPAVAINVDHFLWKSTGLGTQRVIGHESLHTAGLRDQTAVINGVAVRAYKHSGDLKLRAYRQLMGTPKALISPEHLIDLVYPLVYNY